MTDEPIDIQQYHIDYARKLPKGKRQAIRQSHFDRMQQGNTVWNAWAEQVLAAIEKTYPANASEAEKLAIRNQYQIDFSGFDFKKYANFQNFIFPISTSFFQATFPGETYFLETIFSGKADFRETIFSDGADFWRVTFSGKADFFGSTFSDKAYFEETTFSGESISFLGAQFQQQILFLDLQFTDTAKAIPCDFRQVDFHLPPLMDSFPSDLSKFIQTNTGKKRDKDFYQDCEAKFRALKQLAEGNNHHQKALEFYGCELYCQRRATNGARNPKNWASYFYGWLSDYGLSLLRPFILWLAVMLGGIGLQAINDGKISFSPTVSVNCERVIFYAVPSMPPFVSKPLYQKEVRHRLYPKDAEKPAGQLPPFNRGVRFFQTLTTFIALFLLGLALRNRFKIR